MLVSLLLNHPVEYVIIFEAHSVEEVFEKLSQVSVVRSVFKLQTSAIVHVLSKLLWQTFAEILYGSFHFLLLNQIVFLFLSLGS